MQKSFQTLLWCITLVFMVSLSVFAQDNSKEVVRYQTETKSGLTLQTKYFEGGEDVLFDNGPLVTLPGGGCGGNDASLVDAALNLTLYGWGAQQSAGNSMADDFTSGASWNIDSIKFFAYQTNAPTTTSPITGVYVRIWSGDPAAGGTIVYGDLTTNVMARTGFSHIHRALVSDPANCARGVFEVVANIGVNLPAGTYWVEATFSGSASFSGPWTPPVTISGVANTGNAQQNLSGVWGPALNNTTPNGWPFIVYGNAGAACPVGPATNPSPASGTTDVPISGNTASWTNGSGTTAVEVWFGPVGNLTQVYDGTPITSLSLAAVEPLEYSTDYGWKVVCKNDTCSGAPVETWTFTTIADPNIVVLFSDDFETADIPGDQWTITNDGGTCVWTVAPISQNTYTLPPTAAGNVLSADADFCGSTTTLLSTATVTNPIDASNYNTVWIEFDNDWQAIDADDFGYVEVSLDGTNWTAVRTFDVTDVRNTHENVDISAQVATSAFYLRLRTIQPGWDWWWAVDNIVVKATDFVPVELTSFSAKALDNTVSLNWTTSTETNNSGFQVERSSGGNYEVVGFVAGHGTSTEIHNYSYVDGNLKSGNYTYRLKQIDYDGTFEYSNAVEVEVIGVREFALDQNYPNPFNPSTKINFSLAVESNVTLKIFDVLGQEVMTILNGQLTAGSHDVSFNASGLNSGVYFYRIDAAGLDGQKFSSVKKMILTK